MFRHSLRQHGQSYKSSQRPPEPEIISLSEDLIRKSDVPRQAPEFRNPGPEPPEPQIVVLSKDVIRKWDVPGEVPESQNPGPDQGGIFRATSHGKNCHISTPTLPKPTKFDAFAQDLIRGDLLRAASPCRNCHLSTWTFTNQRNSSLCYKKSSRRPS